MRWLFTVCLLLMPVCAVASESLIEIVGGHNATITDGVVHQGVADTRTYMLWKLQAIYNNTKYQPFGSARSYITMIWFTDDKVGFLSDTFTTPNDLEDLAYFRFGLNGSERDTLVHFNIKDIQPNTTYTLQWRVLNTAQGEVAWTDMFLTHCGDGYELALGDETCSRACENQTVNGGHIPPDVARVYEPDACTYDPVRLTCDDDYGKTWDGQCVHLCTAGITKLHVGDVIVPLYSVRQDTPAINVLVPGRSVCYGTLVPGVANGALNVKIGDTIYHSVR